MDRRLTMISTGVVEIGNETMYLKRAFDCGIESCERVCILSEWKREKRSMDIPNVETYLAVSSTRFQKCLTESIAAIPGSNVAERNNAGEEVSLGQYTIHLNLYDVDSWKSW